MTSHQHDEQSYSATKSGNRSILPAEMMSVEEARARILEVFDVLPAVEMSLSDALGLVLAEDVRAGGVL